MAGLLALLGTARDALAAQSGALSVTGQNVGSANLPGYVKQTPILMARAWAGGGGVEFAGGQRQFDRFVHAKLVSEGGKHASAEARLDALTRLEHVMSPPSGGIAERLGAFFSAVAGLAANPSDSSARSTLLARSQDLAESVSGAARDVASLRADLLERATGEVGAVNDLASRIARLNENIGSAEASGGSANELRDERDELVRQLGEKVGARAIEDERGRYTVFVGGTALVEGSEASSMSAGVTPTGELRFDVVRPGGTTLDVSARVEGALGGLREARDVDLVAAQADLDRFAYDFANAVNAVHAAGFGLDGMSGRALFSPPASVAGAAYAMSLDAGVATDPRRLAASSTAAGLPGNADAALALQALASSPMPPGADAPSARLASLLGRAGASKQSAERESELREGTMEQARALHESRSGVSLDEEMVDLSRFQRSFEASTRVLRAADELLKGLIQEL
jgi:flagellar hook-associated protein 1 FlgK